MDRKAQSAERLLVPWFLVRPEGARFLVRRSVVLGCKAAPAQRDNACPLESLVRWFGMIVVPRWSSCMSFVLETGTKIGGWRGTRCSVRPGKIRVHSTQDVRPRLVPNNATVW